METITIEVDKEVAKAYRESALNKQEKVNTIIKLFFQPEFAIKAFRKWWQISPIKPNNEGWLQKF